MGIRGIPWANLGVNIKTDGSGGIVGGRGLRVIVHGSTKYKQTRSFL
jgi:hypothetical protein